jgi:hypothetical protein
MKVYIAECGFDYEGFDISGVFDSEEKANKYLEENYCESKSYVCSCKKSHVDYTCVEEREVE